MRSNIYTKVYTITLTHTGAEEKTGSVSIPAAVLNNDVGEAVLLVSFGVTGATAAIGASSMGWQPEFKVGSDLADLPTSRIFPLYVDTQQTDYAAEAWSRYDGLTLTKAKLYRAVLAEPSGADPYPPVPDEVRAKASGGLKLTIKHTSTGAQVVTVSIAVALAAEPRG